MVKLKMSPSGRVYFDINIKVYNSASMKSFRFKVDTGADFTTISKESLYELGYSDAWINANKILAKEPTSVASGEKVESYFIHLPVINIYGIEGINYPVGVLMDKEGKLPKPSCKDCEYTMHKKLDYRLLIGNDILSCFDMKFSRADNTVVLEPLSCLKNRNTIYVGRELNLVDGMRGDESFK